MRRLVIAALVAAAGCNQVTQLDAGPADRYYFPTGAAVTGDGLLVVASSNFDLRYAEETGGSVIAVDPALEPAPDLAALKGTVQVASLGAQLALADPAACPDLRDPPAGAVAVLPVRGANVVYRLRVASGGAVSCADCAVPVGGTGRVDPWGVGLACGPGIARAFVGYLQSGISFASITQLDLTRDPSDPEAVQHVTWNEFGQIRGFAYDAARERLYLAHATAAGATSLRWVDLGGGCRLGDGLGNALPLAEGGCASAATIALPQGIEPRGIALSRSDVPFRRAYLTARIFDPIVAGAAGFRTTEYDGRLVVADLVETLGGRVELALARELDLGYGAGDVVVLPAGPRPAGSRDVVAALASDSGRVTIYDDETGEAVGIGADLAGTGAPLVGHLPISLAVDPIVRDGVARLYVLSFQESFVTAIDVPLLDPASACLVAPGGGCAAGAASVRRIRGGVAP